MKVLNAQGKAVFIAPADLALLEMAAKHGLDYALVRHGFVLALGTAGQLHRATHRYKGNVGAWLPLTVES